MRFKLLPILDIMEELYRMPRNPERFTTYLTLLQGTDGTDMVLPIAGYNPMGSEKVLVKLRALKNLGAEDIVQKELDHINDKLPKTVNEEISVVLNLADDQGGSWSHFATTDHTNKFAFGPLLKRKFCTPYFWTSESYSKNLIASRLKSTVLRTIYWNIHAEPISLQDCFEQEVYVQFHLKEEWNYEPKQFEAIEQFYLEHAASEEYSLLFNFFYGDEASQQLGYTTYGRKSLEGFHYAKYIATTKVDQI